MNAFVYGLWGDDLIQGWRRAFAHAGSWDTRRHPPIADCHLYAWGQDNFATLPEIRKTLCNSNAVENFTGRPDRRPDEHPRIRGALNFGIRAVHHKTRTWQRALEEYDQIVWLDFDVQMVADIPDGFWQRLRSGPPLQAKLIQYRRGRCPWRDKDRSKTPCGSCVYVRRDAPVDEMIAWHLENPRCGDEVVMAWVIDQHLGGWSPSDYKEAGFEMPFFRVRRQVHPTNRSDMVFSKTLGRS